MMETWNLKDLHDEKDTEGKIEKIKAKAEEFKKCKERLKENMRPEELLDMIQLNEEIGSEIQKLNGYYELKATENMSDTETLAKIAFMSQLATEISNEMIFFTLWFIGLDDKHAQRFIDSKELSDYKYYLESLRREKPYTKTEEIEKILSLKNITGANAYNVLYEVFTNSFKYDFDGKKGITKEELSAYFRDKDPKKRKEAYEEIFRKYEENKPVLTEIYRDIVLDWYNEGIKIRNYSSPISIRNISNDVPDNAVEALLNTIRKNAKLFQEYFRLKYELNKKNGEDYEYSRYHAYAPYNAGIEEKYGYEKTKKLVLEALREFDPRFEKAALEIFSKKHVHSHPKPNKRSGAFCYGITNTDTPYIMLNHTDKLRDVFTMIHELGHGIHDIFAGKQPNLLYHPCLPMAETASVFGEMILAEKMLRESTSTKEKMAIIMNLLDDDYATLTRQAYFVLFEKAAHDGMKEAATQEELDSEYYALLKEQFGDMEIPRCFRQEWNYIPHIHATPFYCYAYAWGKLLVLALYKLYREDGDGFKEKYIELLSTGGALSPKEMLAKLGINPEDEGFWQKGMDIIQEQIDELKELSKKT